jgi:hypothetical protein
VLPYNYLTQQQWGQTLQECGIVPGAVNRRLGLSPPWAEVWFGRSLHFLAICDVLH